MQHYSKPAVHLFGMAGGANHSRLTSTTYPNGRVIGYSYASGLDSNISRLSAITDSGVTLEGYSYLGVGTVVARSHPQPGVDLSYPSWCNRVKDYCLQFSDTPYSRAIFWKYHVSRPPGL